MEVTAGRNVTHIVRMVYVFRILVTAVVVVMMTCMETIVTWRVVVDVPRRVAEGTGRVLEGVIDVSLASTVITRAARAV